MSLPVAMTGALPAEELRLIDAYWRAANYLSAGQVYLLDNHSSASHCGRSTSSRAWSATSGPSRA
jgi:phosphoketolase